MKAESLAKALQCTQEELLCGRYYKIRDKELKMRNKK
jgi:hypothetical protein